MPFLGSTPADQYQSLAKQTITGDGSTAYTLNRSVTNAYDMEVFINNVRQEPDTSYTASGNTITFTAAVTSSDSCYLIYQGQSVGSINPPANSVGTSQIVNDGVHTANIADTAVTHAKLHTSLDLSSKTLTMPAGHVIQVVNVEKLDTASTNSTMGSGFIDTGLTLSITPQFSSSKILVTVDAALGVTNTEFNYMRVVRNVGGGAYSMISEAATPGSRNAIHGMVFGANHGRCSTQTFNHLDSPATTSAVNYKIQFATGGGGGYVYMGQSNRDNDGASADPRASSRIILQEIAQ